MGGLKLVHDQGLKKQLWRFVKTAERVSGVMDKYALTAKTDTPKSESTPSFSVRGWPSFLPHWWSLL